jgi:hypothetical protein
MAIMSTFSVAHVFDEWLLYSVNTTIHDREASVFLPPSPKGAIFLAHNARAKDTGQALALGRVAMVCYCLLS